MFLLLPANNSVLHLGHAYTWFSFETWQIIQFIHSVMHMHVCHLKRLKFRDLSRRYSSHFLFCLLFFWLEKKLLPYLISFVIMRLVHFYENAYSFKYYPFLFQLGIVFDFSVNLSCKFVLIKIVQFPQIYQWMYFKSIFQENSRQDKKYKWQVSLLMSLFQLRV